MQTAGPEQGQVTGAMRVVSANMAVSQMGSVMTKHFAIVLSVLALGAVTLSACGTNMEQRAATGAATGLIVAGPVGAAVGAVAGVVVNEAEKKN